MKISMRDVINGDRWLNMAVQYAICELPRDVMQKMVDEAAKTEEYDVMLVINGVECEPTVLGSLLKNIENHIDKEAEALHNQIYSVENEKLQQAMSELQESLNETRDKILSKHFTEMEINELKERY